MQLSDFPLAIGKDDKLDICSIGSLICKERSRGEELALSEEGQPKRRERHRERERGKNKRTAGFSSIIISYMCSIHELLFNTRAKLSKMWSGSSPCLPPKYMYILSILRRPTLLQTPP